MNRKFIEVIEASPVIGAVKSVEGLEKCLKSEVGVIFILFWRSVAISGILWIGLRLQGRWPWFIWI